MTEATNARIDVLVIGGTSSLATPVIKLLSSNESKVYATFRNAPKNKGTSTKWSHLDVSSQDSILEFLVEIHHQEFDFILVFVGAPYGEEDTPAVYVETYLTNMIFLLQSLSSNLKSNVISAMLHVSSRSAIYPSRDVMYSAVKGGLNSALRSISRQLPQNSKIISIAPGLVLGSTMAADMPPDIRADHIVRSSNELLDINGFAAEFLALMNNVENIESGTITELGPRYS